MEDMHGHSYLKATIVLGEGEIILYIVFEALSILKLALLLKREGLIFMRIQYLLTFVIGISKVCILCMCNCFLSGNSISPPPAADRQIPTN